MLQIDLSPELEQILEFYANKDGVSKSVLARKAIAEYLEDREDSDIAVEASRNIGETFSLEEVIREYGLEDTIRSESEEAVGQTEQGEASSGRQLSVSETCRTA